MPADCFAKDFFVKRSILVGYCSAQSPHTQLCRKYKMKRGAQPKSEAYEVSIVVPTFKESKNIEILTLRIFQTLSMEKINKNVELLFVEDNSGKDTEETVKIVSRLAKDFPVRIRVRERSEGTGLSSAVLLGLQHETTSPYLLVMDADLQHEPESIPTLLRPVLSGEADFAIGSRHAEGAETSESWPLVRKIISWGATALAKPLTSCNDPMSGFFALPRTTLERAKYLNPTGYKIGLELMVRCECRNIAEVPITFRDREFGESKLTMKQNVLYLQHLARLYRFMYPWWTLLFCIVVLVLVVLSMFVIAYLLQEM